MRMVELRGAFGQVLFVNAEAVVSVTPPIVAISGYSRVTLTNGESWQVRGEPDQVRIALERT